MPIKPTNKHYPGLHDQSTHGVKRPSYNVSTLARSDIAKWNEFAGYTGNMTDASVGTPEWNAADVMAYALGRNQADGRPSDSQLAWTQTLKDATGVAQAVFRTNIRSVGGGRMHEIAALAVAPWHEQADGVKFGIHAVKECIAKSLADPNSNGIYVEADKGSEAFFKAAGFSNLPANSVDSSYTEDGLARMVMVQNQAKRWLADYKKNYGDSEQLPLPLDS